jgi:hypothetical protein
MAPVHAGVAGVTRAELVQAFAGFPDRLAVAAREAAGRPVPDGEWGPGEVVRHLIAVEAEVWQARLARLATEEDPQWSWAEPGQAPGLDDAGLDAILTAFTAARATTVGSIRALDDAGWARHGTHATYGRLDVEGLIALAIDHDQDHLRGVTG